LQLGVSIEDRFWFTGPVFYGDTITIEVWILELYEETRTLVWEASATNEQGDIVLKARATLKYPRPKIE
jgi:3-hydroxybutyryl-CoA dehydratase